MDNNKEQYEQALQKLSMEYAESLSCKEYRLGKNVYKFVNAICKGQFKIIFDFLKGQTRKRKLQRISLKNRMEPERQIEDSLVVVSDYKVKIKVYSCIVGAYDVPHVPLVKYSNCEYILFTDQPVKDCGWTVKEIPDYIKKDRSNSAINRYIKFHPFELFDADYALYIDGNVRLISDITNMLKNVSEKTGMAMFMHRIRDCIYDEAIACKILKKGNTNLIDKQIERYKAEGFPYHYGMKEATVILSNLKSETAKMIFESWWNEYNDSESGRDQIAFPYILWKHNFLIEDIGNLGSDIYKDGHFLIYRHNR